MVENLPRPSEETNRLPAEDLAPSPPPPSDKRKSGFREMLETAMIAVVIFLLIHAFIPNYTVDGRSMMPTFENGERVIVNRTAYGSLDAWDLIDWIPGVSEHQGTTLLDFGTPERGDVVVFTPPTPNSDEPYIKRVIGLPGDEIVVRSDAVYVNGVRIQETYVDSANRCDRGWQYCGDKTITVPPGGVYVLGDNRGNSVDSRSFGILPQENIIGRAWVVIWPTSAWSIVDHEDYPELEP